MEEIENFFNCPYCGNSISMIFDTSAGSQQYIEDCEICCHPIEINFSIDNGCIKILNIYRTDI